MITLGPRDLGLRRIEDVNKALLTRWLWETGVVMKIYGRELSLLGMVEALILGSQNHTKVGVESGLEGYLYLFRGFQEGFIIQSWNR